MPRYFALIPAAGSGSRMGETLPKQYLTLARRPLLAQAIERFCAHPRIEAVFVALAPGDERFAQHDWSHCGDKLKPIYCGGEQRAGTVRNALSAVASQFSDQDWVLVHDAARPCLSAPMIDRLIDAVAEHDAGGLLALPLTDTLKMSDAESRVTHTLPRDGLWQAQTPQMFRLGLLARALLDAPLDQLTDEASAVERLGMRPLLVAGDVRNLKVTYAQDLALAENMLESSNMKIGQGFDVHALVDGRPLIIGGVTIPFGKGLAGHSDADVLLHAVCDALLGAAGLGDIGRHFPDTDARYQGADSRALLREVARLIRQQGAQVRNVDATIIAQAPRMAPHTAAMCANIAADLGIDASQVNVKAKTTEHLGFTGRGEGIAAEAVALLR